MPSSRSCSSASAKGARMKRVRHVAGRAQAIGHQARVAAAAERAVDRELARLGVEEVDELAGQDRDVRGGHVNQHGRRRR
jgi:hypothetical protein